MIALEKAAELKILLELEISTRCFPVNPELPQQVMVRRKINPSGDMLCVINYSEDGIVTYAPQPRTFGNDYRVFLGFIAESLRRNHGVVDNEELGELLSAEKDSGSGGIFYISLRKP